MGKEADLHRLAGIDVIDVDMAFQKYVVTGTEAGLAERGLRIGVTGANSTGITTVARGLAAELKLPLLSEVARAVFEHGFKPGIQGSMVSQSTIWFTQLFLEHQKPSFVTDRFVVCATAHAEVLAEMSGDPLDAVCATAMANATVSAVSGYSAVFYTPIEFALVDDGVRDTDSEFRERLDAKIVELFNRFGLTYYELRGSEGKRHATAMSILQELSLIS